MLFCLLKIFVNSSLVYCQVVLKYNLCRVHSILTILHDIEDCYQNMTGVCLEHTPVFLRVYNE